ncbi:Replication factor A protein 3 [Lachnellula cervina]|uniref:Replication factor A protein 3 n=1 Tax=Lachnellula cervina TaxID=1316786 RepID=A0A7D8UR86_9HELO|nr:Replication factor A protein 3 [Lachnellula cervina]
MADTLSTPRILAPHLDAFQNRTIRLIGRVTQLRGETASIDAQGTVTAILNRDAHLSVGHAVEIVGKVQGDLSVRVLQSTDFGAERDFDFAAAEALVDATHRYKEIFYSD